MNDAKPPSFTPIAIIGVGCMFAQAADPGSYWANIKNRVDAITEIPATHWRPEDYLDPNPKAPDRTYAARGGFLSPVDFPPLEFGITPNTLEGIDTTQLLGLMVARQALDDAGYGGQRAFDRSRVSVILGVTGALELVIPLSARLGHPIWRRALHEAGVPEDIAQDVVSRIADAYVGWQEDSFPGLLGNVVAGRIANRLDLGATNCVVDAACASSLSALHLGMLELAAGRCDMVLSGGLDAFNDIFMYMCFSKTPALSPTGNAKPFDARGDGTILGEGLGIVVLKRLPDAVRDGDRIYAVIRSLGSSSDGKGQAIYAPSATGQGRALRMAYELAGVTPQTIELVEAHGTGTKAGDATEVAALTDVYGTAERQDPWCALGSVKSQIGHTKAAAGVAGLIKAALALHHKVLPPTIKVEQPIDALSADQTPFYVNTEARPWLPRSRHPRRAAVSAFGFGGSNFHCVLEEHGADKPGVDWDGDVQIIPFAARTPAGIQQDLAAFPRAPAWTDLRAQAARARAAFKADQPCRLCLVVEKGRTDLPRLLASASAFLDRAPTKSVANLPEGFWYGTGAPAGKLGFLFPGQGSQYVGMLRDLACHFPEVQEALAAADASFDDGRRLSDLIYPRPAFEEAARTANEEALRATDIGQPALGAVSLGALQVLKRFNVLPQAVAGHSYGELVALAASGRFDAEALRHLSRLRGRLMAQGTGDRGAMLAVFAPRARVTTVLRDEGLDLIVANHNAPNQVVLSGSTPEIVRAAELFLRHGNQCKRLPVPAAFHSPMVAGIRQAFEQALAELPLAATALPVFANTTGNEYPAEPGPARALLANQLAQPVEFVATIEKMYQTGVRTFLEVGPGNKLTGLVAAILEGREHAALALDGSTGKRSGMADLARMLAQLAARGHAVELPRWDEGEAERAQSARPKPTLTVPISGANYVKPKQGKQSSREAAVNRRPAHTLAAPVPHVAGSNGEVNGKEKSNGSMGSAVNGAKRASSPRLDVVKTMATVRSNSEPMQAAHESSALGQALRTSQENLLALQKLGEQTAELHRQFLEGQDKTLGVFQSLLDQQQRMLQASLGLGFSAAPVAAEATGGPLQAEAAPQPAQVTPPLAFKPALASAAVESPSITVNHRVDAAPRPAEVEPILPMLLAVVSEKTGYPADMLDVDMELDSDLGIDSIKRVEIFSALQERLPSAPVPKPEHMGTLRSLRHVADFLAGVHGAAPVRDAGNSSKALPPPLHVTVPDESFAEVLLQVVAEKTGYPAEMLALDMELDSDLGIDSIKRVEIFSALQERLPDAPVPKPEHMGSLRSLRHVVDFLSQQAGPLEDLLARAVTQKAAPGNPLRRYVLGSAPLREEGRGPVALAADGEVWIAADASGLAGQVANRLGFLGHRCRLVEWQELEKLKPPARLTGLVILANSRESDDVFLTNSFRLLQLAGPALRQGGRAGGSMFVTVSRLDGTFGLTGPSGNTLSGGLAGLAKTAAQEWPEVQCKALDVAADWDDADEVLAAVVEEILTRGPIEVGLSGKGKHQLRLTEVPLAAPPAENVPLRKGDVVIITGGARGVTAEVAVALAGAFAPTLVLIGRSPAPSAEPAWLVPLTEEAAIKRALVAQAAGPTSPKEIGEQFDRWLANREILHNIKRMETAGAKVLYRSVDVRDARSVEATLEQVRLECGPIKGLIHGAGVLADRLIEAKTLDQFQKVYATKVSGLRSLLENLSEDDLRVLVLFSSSTARFGRKGQVDYAVANEVLNKLAQHEARQRSGCRVVSVNWGPWDGGMVTPQLRQLFEKEAVGLIPLPAGAGLLVRELSQPAEGAAEVVILAGPAPYASADHPDEPREAVTTESLEMTVPDLVCAFERTLALDQHPFLKAHVLDGRAVLPLAMSAEWLAHGAMHGNPGLAFHGLQNLRVLKGVILEDGRPCVLRVLTGTASKKDGLYHVPVEMRGIGAEHEILHARAEILLTAQLPEPEQYLENIAVRPYRHSARELYHEFLFHGTALQGIERVDSCSEEGIMAAVKSAPAPTAWIKQPLRGNWLADPLALDCAFQMMILWCFEHYGTGSLPCFVGRYRQFRRAFPREGVRVAARVKRHDRQRASADITFLDGAGQMIAVMEDYECVLDAALQERFRHNRLAAESVPTA